MKFLLPERCLIAKLPTTADAYFTLLIFFLQLIFVQLVFVQFAYGAPCDEQVVDELFQSADRQLVQCQLRKLNGVMRQLESAVVGCSADRVARLEKLRAARLETLRQGEQTRANLMRFASTNLSNISFCEVPTLTQFLDTEVTDCFRALADPEALSTLTRFEEQRAKDLDLLAARAFAEELSKGVLALKECRVADARERINKADEALKSFTSTDSPCAALVSKPSLEELRTEVEAAESGMDIQKAKSALSAIRSRGSRLLEKVEQVNKARAERELVGLEQTFAAVKKRVDAPCVRVSQAGSGAGLAGELALTEAVLSQLGQRVGAMVSVSSNSTSPSRSYRRRSLRNNSEYQPINPAKLAGAK